MRPRRHFVVRIVVQVEMTDLVRDHHELLPPLQAFLDPHQPKPAVQRAERAWLEVWGRP